MEEAYKAYLKSVDERIAGAKISQLAMAAPLESSGPSKATRSTEQRKAPEANPTVPNQKLALVHALLSIGALKPALAVLTQYPWMVDACPALADLLIRVLRHSIASLYESNFPSKPGLAGFAKPRARYGATGVVPPPERRPQLTLIAPTPPSTHTVDFIFFYPRWSDRIPVCSTVADLVEVVEPLMRFVGVHISRDPLFLNKFVRLAGVHFASVRVLSFRNYQLRAYQDCSNRLRTRTGNLLQTLRTPSKHSGSRFSDSTSFLPYHLFVETPCVLWKFGTYCARTMSHFGGGCMASGRLRPTSRIRSFAFAMSRRTGRPRESFVACHTILLTPCREP